MGNNYTFEGCTVKTLLSPATVSADGEGDVLVDITGRRGTALAYLTLVEGNIAATETMDFTIHNVASDSDTLDSTNLVSSFTQIVGSGSALSPKKTESISINLEGLEEKYLQAKVNETGTYSAVAAIVIVLPPTGYLPTDPD